MTSLASGRCVALWLLLVPTSVLAQGVGLLPTEGEPALAGKIDSELSGSLAARGLSTVVRASELQALLRRQLQLDGPLARTDQLLQQASDQLLRMQRGEAVRLTREAVALLQGIDARLLAPSALARAQHLLARALLLRPADEAGAREAFREALWADPRHQPDLDQSPPRVLALWRAARDTLPASPPPSAETLARLAARGGVSHLVWIAVRPGPELALVVFRARDRAMRARNQRTTEAELLAEATRLVLRGVRTAAPASRPGPTSREVVVILFYFA